MGSADTGTTAEPTTFGVLVRQYRHAAALSQAALAERAGLSTDAISVIERGKRGVPRPDTVARLAQALDLCPEERSALIAAAAPAAGPPADSWAGSSQAEPPTLAPSGRVTPLPLPVPLTGLIGRERDMLLVLDNFEQVVTAAPLVADLLTACPQLRVLATSRVPLHVRGEHECMVCPLAVSDPAHLPDLPTIAQYPAVALFVARAQQVKADFALTAATAPAIADICARLDGLPLAIELAAAHVRVFPPQALLARLSRRLELLTAGPQDLPMRQRTLRATIDWSYGLLTTQERVLFARLSVFMDGATLEAIEAICNLEGDLDVVAGVESLLQKSMLVQTERDGEARFVLLETLHEYARERLVESGAAEAVQRRHAAYYLGLAKAVQLTRPEPGPWTAWPAREDDNLGAVLGAFQDSGTVAHKSGQDV